jgi:uncharacterized protein
MTETKSATPSQGWYTKGDISLQYKWPMGEAERAFFGNLKDRAVLTGAHCRRCDRTMVPPRSFCEECFEREIEYVEVPPMGQLVTFAESYFSLDGKRLDEPFYVGVIRLDDTAGGLFHRLSPNGKTLEIGMKVRAVFADDRNGDILDIRHFEPVD